MQLSAGDIKMYHLPLPSMSQHATGHVSVEGPVGFRGFRVWFSSNATEQTSQSRSGRSGHPPDGQGREPCIEEG